MQKMQDQLDNLTSIITTLVQEREGKTNSDKQIPVENEDGKSSGREVIEKDLTEGDPDKKNLAENKIPEEISKILGEDQEAAKFIEINVHPGLKERWQRWIKEGLPKENKKIILETYPRKGELYTEAPQVNLEILPALTEISVKRDKHFVETQNCVGSAISALAAAVSMLLEEPEEGIDQEKFMKYLCDTGQL